MTGEGIEDHVRRVVARHLGVPVRRLAPDVSLHDDLGGDRTAVRDLVLAVERRLGVRMETQVLDTVRSYGELVAATIEAIRAQRAQLQQESRESASGRVRIAGPQGPVVERAGRLTPYVLESVCDDARRAGPGTTVSVCVAEPTADDQLERLRERLAVLERRGVTVQVARRAEPGRGPTRL